jgi:hypothetical protein
MEPTVEKDDAPKQCVLNLYVRRNGNIFVERKTTMEFSPGIKNGNQITIQKQRLKYIDHIGM